VPRAGRDRGIDQCPIKVSPAEDADPVQGKLDAPPGRILQDRFGADDGGERRGIEPLQARQDVLGNRTAAGLLAWTAR